MQLDVAIIGGGPAGSTLGTLLKKYNPRMNVAIFERARFPRDHVGESQLPVIGEILNEMGVWDKIEAANFPIKIGATYRWGRTDDLWDFEFIEGGRFEERARPGRYEGQRTRTAFQVDRAVYDKILLDHARSFGCIVQETNGVVKVNRDEDSVQSLELQDESVIQARIYVDASGHSGILRRSMGVKVHEVSKLQNIAVWDYWQDARWATEIGVGGTRVQVLSLPYGWLWFIPVGPTRTSIGLILPADYYKMQKQDIQELYLQAVRSDPLVSRLTKDALRENKLSTTKDWSFVAERLAGNNWFLVGESAGFADPILAAGMSLAHVGARDLAYALLALFRNDFEPEWLKSFYSRGQIFQIRQHIRFAEFWYTANGVFSDLKETASLIAKDAGLELSADKAWAWLGQGGFIDSNGNTDLALYGLLASKQIVEDFTGGKTAFAASGQTHFQLDLTGAEKDWSAIYRNGRIDRFRSFRKGTKTLVKRGIASKIISALGERCNVEEVFRCAQASAIELGKNPSDASYWTDFFRIFEAMIQDGWIIATAEEGAVEFPEQIVDFSEVIHVNRD
jgi:flavin-dependent dehydrogenase